MDDENYDEFGNYLGSDLGSGSEDLSSEEEEDEWAAEGQGQDDGMEDDEEDGLTALEAEDESKQAIVEYDPNAASAVILHEDKQYYPAAQEVYPGAEVLVQTEDSRAISDAIVSSGASVRYSIAADAAPADTSFDFQFLAGLMDTPALIRNVSLVGALHSGKTSVADQLVRETHPGLRLAHGARFTDTTPAEQARGISVKCAPLSLVLPALSGKHFLVNLMDAPGHANFSDERSAALRLSDGAVVVVDAVEGLMYQTAEALRELAREDLPVVLLVNKVDRLILELKLPPADAYFKLRHTVDEANAVLRKAGYRRGRLSPELGNVVFGSALHHWLFSVPSFARRYAQRHEARLGSKRGGFDAHRFAKRLWGDVYLHSDRSFQRRPEEAKGFGGSERTFIQFVLRPLYKLYSQTLSREGAELEALLRELGVELTRAERRQDLQPLLRTVLGRFFGDSAALTEAVVQHVRSPPEAAAERVPALFTGDLDSRLGRGLLAADPEGPLLLHVAKLFPRPDASAFDAFGRVLSGTVRRGQRVRVLGEGFSAADQEDSATREVGRLWVLEARYRVEVERAGPGNWVLLEGVDESIAKTATLLDQGYFQGAGAAELQKIGIVRPLRFGTQATVKLAIEPLNPSELPKMLEGLRKVSKTYPLAVTRAEESGEHVILGTGELYLDCLLQDLRTVYAEIEIRVADPVVRFAETVAESSAMKCVAETPNRQCELAMLAEPLDQGLAQDLEAGRVRLDKWDKQRVAEFFRSEYGWDALASRSVWAFGPEPETGANLLVDDTLPSAKLDKRLLYSVKPSVVEGWQWSTREGPLCEEPVRGVRYKLLDARLEDGGAGAGNRGRHQIIPAARRVAYAAFLLAAPRLMEPVYFVEVQAPVDRVQAVYSVLETRRGHVQSSQPKAGSPFHTVQAYLPVIESFGFETDLRTHTQGQCMAQSVFDHWELVPGDPLDQSIVLRPLEPAPLPSLAREFMVKTRRRKGLSEEVAVNKFFDDRMLLELARHDEQLQAYFQQQANGQS